MAGGLAGKLTKGAGFGVVGHIVMGLIGAFMGGYLFRLAGITAGGTVGSIIVATIGAVVPVIVVKAVRKVWESEPTAVRLVRPRFGSGGDPHWATKGKDRMNDIIGMAWFKDEATYRRALALFSDSGNMPASFEAWKALVERELELIKDSGNIAIRADIDPEAFAAWCASHGHRANSQGRIAFVNQVVLAYRKTGEGTVI